MGAAASVLGPERGDVRGEAMKRIRRRLRRAAISIETILILAVIAIPVLVFVIKFAWPAIKSYFVQGAGEVGIDVQ